MEVRKRKQLTEEQLEERRRKVNGERARRDSIGFRARERGEGGERERGRGG